MVFYTEQVTSTEVKDIFKKKIQQIKNLDLNSKVFFNNYIMEISALY